jgi:hypothetical protein
VEDLLGWAAVVEEDELGLVEAGDEVALLVGDGEDEVDFVGLDLDDRGFGVLRCLRRLVA